MSKRLASPNVISSTIRLMVSGGGPRLHLYIDSRHKKLGPIFKERLGPVEGVFLADPKAARKVFSAEGIHPRHVIPPAWSHYNKVYGCKRGLFFMDGAEWYKYRQIMNPIFLKGNLSISQEIYDAVSNSFLDSCKEYMGREIENLELLLYKNSISSTIGHLLGTSYLLNKDIFIEDIDALATISNAIFASTVNLMHLPIKPVAALDLPPWKKFVSAADSSIIASRKLTEKLLKLELKDGLLKEMVKQNLSVNELQVLILDLMLAAGDTTTYTTQWALYLLSQNYEAVEKLRKDFSYSRGILRETLRLYPAAIFLSRYLQEDLYVFDYIVPKGELVIISLYTIGQLENAYPEPEKFKPDRWSRKTDGHMLGVNEPMAYFPFALGARSCIGRKLAEAQIYHTLSKLFSKCDLQLKEKVDMELKLIPVPTKPIRLLLSEKSR